jgi:hypothetical protein|tara:strand:+ start:17 stop:217 length:201 start_codon:yes stop_codon:yes gene_type:complete
MDHKTLHGWYSEKQLNATKRSYCYKDINDKEIYVTVVSNNTQHKCSFDDLVYMGIMKSFVKKINHK